MTAQPDTPIAVPADCDRKEQEGAHEHKFGEKQDNAKQIAEDKAAEQLGDFA